MSFLNRKELFKIGFKTIGENVLISDKASIYGAKKIEIANDVRIDDFCILSAGEEGIEIGNNVHIAAYCSLIGKGLIKLKGFAGLSSRVALYSSSDDYSGKFLTNPTVPEEFKNVKHGSVIVGKHVIIGVSASILPNVEIGDGSAVGAYSLVTKNVPPGVIVNGVPAKFLMKRSQKLFELEKQFLKMKTDY